jgi:glucose/arabinose dehydrogenase
LPELPGGPIDHHWTKSLVASPDGKFLYVGVGSNSNITENGIEAENNRAAIWEVDRESGRWRLFASRLQGQSRRVASAFRKLHPYRLPSALEQL